jgi:AraC-like DNA-binding protein
MPAFQTNKSWSGTVLLWEDHGLFLGRAGTADLHDSPAIKVCVAIDGTFTLSVGSSDTTRSFSAAVIRAGTPHAIDGGGTMAMILLAPEGDLGRVFAGSSGIDGIISLDDVADELSEIFRQSGDAFDGEQVEALLRVAVKRIASIPACANQQPMDPRVAQSIEWIRAGREGGILVRDIAAEVDLSESRFSHLFSEHLRVPVRRYLLWLRLRDALHMLASAENLTEAAHSAGFSDSAHLTRTFRSALGIAPSDLVRYSTVTSFLR